MMLIAVTFVALACAAPDRIHSASGSSFLPDAPKPLHIAVTRASDVSQTLARKIFDEAEAIWRSAGITFLWDESADRASATLEVVIDNDKGGLETRLGWILFDGHNEPGHVLHLSYANALTLLGESSPVVGIPLSMPITERDLYLGRAMGRALAHELGHYLLASKTHEPKGLMRATLSANELFAPVRSRFDISQALCQTLWSGPALSRLNPTTP